MSDFNTLADSLDRARAQGIRDGRNQVMQIVRAALPGTDADEIESRLIEATQFTTAEEPAPRVAAPRDPSASGMGCSAGSSTAADSRTTAGRAKAGEPD